MFYRYKQQKTKRVINKLLLEHEQSLFLAGSVRYLRFLLYVISFIGASVSWQSASAQTFDSAITAELDRVCNLDRRTLSGVCTGLGGNVTVTGVGSQSQPNSILISQQQLKDLQNNKEKESMVPGGSADVLSAQWGEHFSTFLTVGATTLRHRDNEFEQGYTATIPSVTLGGGYLLADNLEMGLAFNYSNSDADYHTGGGFEVDSYSPLFFINYLPFDNAFTNLVLSYTRQDQANDRIAVVNDPGGTEDPLRRATTADFNSNQYNLNFLSGYDFSVESFTIGPRVGVNFRHWEMNAYQESSNTGLELSYDRQRQTSIQTTLGLAASYAHSTSVGVVVPQISATWVHEFANDSRIINAQFVQTTIANNVSFQTERPARDWAVIDLGVSLVIKNGIQAFVNFSTVQGNSNFESYGGNLGVRMSW